MRIRDCKAIAAALGIAPTKVTDAVHDAACKLALILEADQVLGCELLAEATRHVRACRLAGSSWRLRDRREAAISDEELALLERLSDGRADRAEIGQRPASGAAGSAETAPPRRDTSRSRPMPTSPSCK